MATLLLIAAADVLLFSLIGLALVAWLPPRLRRVFLPGLPALGAAVATVALHLTTMVLSVRAGIVIVLVAAVASVAVASRRRRWWRGVGRLAPLLLVAGLVGGFLSLAIVSTPFRTAGATVVQPSDNNDAFYYVTLASWLEDHPATQVPKLGVDPPAYGNVRETLGAGLRLGEELDEAAVSSVTGRDPMSTWSTESMMWLLYMPGAGIAAFGLLGARPLGGLVAGVLMAGSAIVGFELLNQNSSALCGILLAPLALATFLHDIDVSGRLPHRWRRRTHDLDAEPPERMPLWLTALLVDALVGTYTEFTPLLTLGLVAYAAWRGFRSTWVVAARLAEIGGLALLIGPMVWYDAWRQLTLVNGILDDHHPSPFLGVSLTTALARVTGAAPTTLTTNRSTVLPLVVFLAAGVVLAVTVSHVRVGSLLVLGNALGVTLLLGSHFHYFPYAEERAVGLTLPLVVFFACLGWASAVDMPSRLRGAASRRLDVAILLAAIGLGVLFFAVNQGTVAVEANQDWTNRTVGSEFEESAGWVSSVSPDGSDVSAVMQNFFTQLWSMYTLRHSPQVNFPFLYPDYGVVPPLTYDDGRLRHHVLVSGRLFASVQPGAVTDSNRDFSFLDTSRGPLLLAFGTVGASYVEEPSPGELHQWTIDDAKILVVHTPDISTVTMSLTSNPLLPQLPVTIIAGDGSRISVTVGTTPLPVTVPLGSTTVSVIEVDNLEKAIQASPTDSRLLAVFINSITSP